MNEQELNETEETGDFEEGYNPEFLMNVLVFTFHDHFFKITSTLVGDFLLEDEYGTQKSISDPEDLTQIRAVCEEILQGYREEMSMPGAGL